MIAHLMAVVAGSVAAFTGYSDTITATGTQTVSIPAGASTVTVECISSGAGGYDNGTTYGGGGGAYSKKNTYSLAGLTGIYIDVPAAGAYGANGSDALARENSAGGTIICKAAKSWNYNSIHTGDGGQAADGTGDLKYSGGGISSSAGGGGGAAGPSGSGAANSGGTGGTAGGSPAGAGGNTSANGNNYGGGAGAGGATTGAQGWIKLTWA